MTSVSSFCELNLPKPRNNSWKRSFSYSGALLWNSLSESIRAIRSIQEVQEGNQPCTWIIRFSLGNLVNQFL